MLYQQQPAADSTVSRSFNRSTGGSIFNKQQQQLHQLTVYEEGSASSHLHLTEKPESSVSTKDSPSPLPASCRVFLRICRHSRVTGFFHTVSKLGRPCKATTSRLGNHFLPASSSTCKYCRSKCCNLARSPSSLGNEVIFVPDKSRCRNSTNSLMDTGISLRPVNDKSRTLKAGIKWRKHTPE
ncbi:hypothetical protein NC652_016761 [Populus alba x Populus x berolinensis]|nr:hypothetical protein NC652_016761 [Populus alba x Populus x berolinensis]